MTSFGLSFGVFGLLILGLLLVAIVQRSLRSIGESLAEFRRTREDRSQGP